MTAASSRCSEPAYRWSLIQCVSSLGRMRGIDFEG